MYDVGIVQYAYVTYDSWRPLIQEYGVPLVIWFLIKGSLLSRVPYIFARH
jgi:hypothetical protein